MNRPKNSDSYGRTYRGCRAYSKALEAKLGELKDFAIWMTGCGYDFTQHDYFVKKREELLKDD